jgi:hypothetical protein
MIIGREVVRTTTPTRTSSKIGNPFSYQHKKDKEVRNPSSIKTLGVQHR